MDIYGLVESGAHAAIAYYETLAEEIHGRCHHPIVGGTGDFAGAKGLILFKDDVVNLKFHMRGHITLE